MKQLSILSLYATGMLSMTAGIAASLDDVTMEVVGSDTDSVSDVTREIRLPEAMQQHHGDTTVRTEHRRGDDDQPSGNRERARDRDRDQLREELEEARDSQRQLQSGRDDMVEAREQGRKEQQEVRPGQDGMQGGPGGKQGKGGI